jgi:hypothetical protein
MDRGGWVLVGELVDEEVVPAEAGVALPAVRVEDPERGPAPRRAVAVPGNQRFGALADDVASEADPGATGQLQANAGRFRDGPGQAAGETGWLEHDEQRLCPASQRGETTEPVGDGGRPVRGAQAVRGWQPIRGDRAVRGWQPIRGAQATAGQVQDEQVHRAPGEQRATDGQALVERLRGDDHEPFEADAPGDGLDRVEAPGKVDPGDDGARGLGLGREPQDQGGPAARAIAADRDGRRAW